MTEERNTGLEIGTETLEELEATDEPVETALSVASDVPAGTLPLAGGGLVLLSAVRSLARRQWRAIPKAIVGAALLRYGLRRRRASDGGAFEPSYEGIEGGSDGKETSDAAHAARERPDSGRESEIDAGGEIDDSSQLGAEGDTGSRIEYDAEGSEPRSKPALDADDGDPRLDTGGDEVEIDVSESATADEASEAAGPSPEQAQPAQTDSIEPEETPDEDASHMKVEPDEDADSTGDEAGETDESDADEDEGLDDADASEERDDANGM